MATAVQPSPTPRTPSQPGGLLVSSFVGAVYVLASLAVVFYAVPTLWDDFIGQYLGSDITRRATRFALLLAVFAALVRFGISLAGQNSPKGMRGGIFLMIVAFFVAFFVGGAATARFEGPTGQVVAAVLIVAVVFGAFRLFASPRGERWMIALEAQGWFHGSAYKRVLGRLVRRVTTLGILVVGLTGVYSLNYQGTLPDNWDVTLPLVHTAEGGPQTFHLLPDAKYTIPLLLIALTIWIAIRAVNMPEFAEFLIATEAEMNKVSWSSKKRLAQDTVVVLICTVFMALFLLFVDLFWGWLLSRETVGVLPSRNQTDGNKVGPAQAARW